MDRALLRPAPEARGALTHRRSRFWASALLHEAKRSTRLQSRRNPREFLVYDLEVAGAPSRRWPTGGGDHVDPAPLLPGALTSTPRRRLKFAFRRSDMRQQEPGLRPARGPRTSKDDAMLKSARSQFIGDLVTAAIVVAVCLYFVLTRHAFLIPTLPTVYFGYRILQKLKTGRAYPHAIYPHKAGSTKPCEFCSREIGAREVTCRYCGNAVRSATPTRARSSR